jgi:hypothetical protein
VAEVVAADNEGCGCVAEVDGWHWWDAAFVWVEALTSVLACEGYRWCMVAPQVLLALYWCAVFELRHAELLLAVPPHDGFLFLTEPFNFLLNSDQFLLLFYDFVFVRFFIPVLHMDLIELDVALNDLCWRRCSQQWLMRVTYVGLGWAGASAILAGAEGVGEHVVGWLVELDLGNVTEGWLLYSFGDDREGLSGWVVEGWLVLDGSSGLTFVWMETLTGSSWWHYQGCSRALNTVGTKY